MFFFSFELIHSLQVKNDSEFDFVREILFIKSLDEDSARKGSLKQRFSDYITAFREALKNNQNHHLLKLIFACGLAIILITVSFVFLGFVLFIFI